MKLLKGTINKCYEDCPYNQETFDGGSGCMMANKDIAKYEDNGFPYFCPLPDAEEETPEIPTEKQIRDYVIAKIWQYPNFGISRTEEQKIADIITAVKYFCGKPIKIKE